MNPKRLRLIVFPALALLLAACGRGTPIPVYVTPTPVERTPVSTVDLAPSATLPITPGSPTPIPTLDPNATFGPITGLPIGEGTPGLTPTPVTLEGPFGPVVPPDYSPVPADTATPTVIVSPTPFPTLDPSAGFGPAVVPSASLTPSPTVTPVPESLTPDGEGTPIAAAPRTATPTPRLTFGPIVPPGYTLPPSPTRTPVPSVTASPSGVPAPPTPTPIPLPDLDASLIGIQIHPLLTQSEWQAMLDKAGQLNVGWIKVQIAWQLMEPEGPGSQSPHWRETELYLQEADRRGFHVMVSVVKAPAWARPTNEENGPPSDPQYYASFLQSILNRYGQAIDAIEVWNEPNLLREWRGAPINGTQYMRLFAPAYETITAWSRANGHPIQVITAGLAPTGDSQYSVDDRQFLRQMYRAGLANYPDVAIGIHPYAWGNAPESRCCNPVPNRSWDDSSHFFFLDNIEAYREIMVSNGQGSLQLWPTEFGWPTYDGFGYIPPQQFFEYVNEASQANYTIRALDLIQNSGAYAYVGPMMLWNLNFATLPNAVAEGSEMAGYSLLRPDGSERPLFHYLHLALNDD